MEDGFKLAELIVESAVYASIGIFLVLGLIETFLWIKERKKGGKHNG